MRYLVALTVFSAGWFLFLAVLLIESAILQCQ